jgi:hypothetical protein
MTNRLSARLDRIEREAGASRCRVIVYKAPDDASEAEHERRLKVAAGSAGVSPNDLVVCLRQFSKGGEV